MRRASRLFPALLRGGLRGEVASFHHNPIITSICSPSLQRRNSWSSWSSSIWRTPLVLASSARFFGAAAAAAAVASSPSSTSTSSTSSTAEPLPARRSGGEARELKKRRNSSSSRTTTTTPTKKRKNKLDPLVLDAILHTRCNSVSRALTLLRDPPPHIPLEQLTKAGNSLISALGRSGRPHDALRTLERLAELGAPFDSYTAAAAVFACSKAVSKVGTLPRAWAERGREIYRGYIEAAEAEARRAAEAEEEDDEEKKTTLTTRKGQPIRTRPLLRALLDCGSRSMDPEAVWAALDEYDLAGIRPGPSELASLIHAHARRRRRRRRSSVGNGDGENDDNDGESDRSDSDRRGGSAAKARAAASEFLERYGDRWDQNAGGGGSLRGKEGGGDEGREAPPSPPPSPTISMMTPAVYNALLRAHSRAGDLDGAYAVRREMISSGVAPDSGTCRALSECFGEENIELAADLVEAADAERVEFLLSLAAAAGADASSSPAAASSDASSSSPSPSSWSSSFFSVINSSRDRGGGSSVGGDAAGGGGSSLPAHRPREALPFPPALAPPKYLQQREWSLFPVLEADAAAFSACQGAARRGGGGGGGGGRGRAEDAKAATTAISSSTSPSSSLPPPLVLDLHGMSRAAARVVLLVSLRRVVAAAAEPGKKGGSEGVWGRLTKRKGDKDEDGAVPGGLVLIVGRSSGLAGKDDDDSDVDNDDDDSDDEEEGEVSSAASAKAAFRAAAKTAHMGVDGGINASVLSFAKQHLGLAASLDPRNEGRVVVTAEDLDLWVLSELERRRREATAELAGKQAAAVAAVASSAVGFWWVVPKLLAG